MRRARKISSIVPLQQNEKELAQLRHFKEAAKILGKVVNDVVLLLAKHIDTMTDSRVKGCISP